jgi:hypothetical protein
MPKILVVFLTYFNLYLNCIILNTTGITHLKMLYEGKIPNNLNIQKETPSNFKYKMWQKFPIYIVCSLRWEDSRSHFLQAVQFSCHMAMAAQSLWQKECPWSLCKCTLALQRIFSSAIKKNIIRTGQVQHTKKIYSMFLGIKRKFTKTLPLKEKDN